MACKVVFVFLLLALCDDILRANEYTHDFSNSPVLAYDSNQLAANNPIEDTRAEASCLITSGFLFGVFDGHSGGACAQVLAKRLYHYISACLLPHEQLKEYVASLTLENPLELVQPYNDKVQFAEEIERLYQSSFLEFLKELVNAGPKDSFDMSKALEQAFLRLDNDLSREALTREGELNVKTLSVTMSGACACVAQIDENHLHVANVGDCRAVLGSLSDTNTWIPKQLSNQHDYLNKTETNRIYSEHPKEEASHLLSQGRLLGWLAPLRAMGDFMYKWDKKLATEVAAKIAGEHIRQQFATKYHTPPYLTALPEVTYYRLTPKDKFLVLGSDGLWDEISPMEVVTMVGEHMQGKVALKPLESGPLKRFSLGEIDALLKQRKENLKLRPKDSNAATHIIRNALAERSSGVSQEKLAEVLSWPLGSARYSRDDITVTVIYFNSEYLKRCPP